jgi:hypothetical protein
MAFVSVTRLRFRSATYLLPFMLHALFALRQARRSPGSLSTALLRDQQRTFWTVTAWRDESAMRSFMLSGSHRKVMPKLRRWCDEASVVHWDDASPVLPDWEIVHRRMQRDGRRSAVDAPSVDHQAYRIPVPVTGRTREVRFK